MNFIAQNMNNRVLAALASRGRRDRLCPVPRPYGYDRLTNGR
jgi:hypothetical protein